MDSRIGAEQSGERQTGRVWCLDGDAGRGSRVPLPALLPMVTGRSYHLKVGHRKFALVELRP
jgi:hypothetical protein